VTTVFQDALERDEPARGAYLDTACAGDAPLRAEVESLLAAHQAAGHFAEGSPLEALAPSAVEALGVDTRLAPGSHLGAYEIAAPLGAGGMGEVYRARDTRLNRDVALKVLPDHVARESDRLARLRGEAQSLAALNHPNIVTVHSVEEHRGVHFITMELVKGQTLAALLPRNGFALDRFFDIAIPLADAVAAAHAQGIVHRDLKPANVMVTAEGRVKVLDFGLARPTTSAAHGARDVTAPPMTESGVVVGTRSYMSPEQARGQLVDARSDIFALGINLYEMLTGRRPFVGDTPSDVLSAIIKEDPPAVSSIRAGLPRELSRLVRRCLAKDPARRLQSALDLRNELEDLRREIDSGELVAGVRLAASAAIDGRKTWWAAATIGVIALAGVAGWRWIDRSEPQTLRLTNPRQVTFTAAVESNPTWSPDRGRIAFVSVQSGNPDIWVAPASGGSAVNLTADHAGNDVDPAWSPDGNQIAFVSQREGGGVYVMPAIGGRPVRISARGIAEALVSPVWSADGTALAHMRREPDANFIEIVTMGTRESRRLRVPGDQGNRFDLSWSPDGRFFAYVRSANRQFEVSLLWVLRVADGEAVAVTDGTTGEWSPSWSSDSRTLYIISNRGGSRDLWQQRLTAAGAPDGDARPITVGVGMQQAALSPDRRRLAYARGRPVANVWRVPILDDGEAGWEDADQLTFDEAFVETLDLHPDGARLIISSDRGGSQELWVRDLTESNGTDMRQLTADRGPDGAPQVSPDGRHIAFHSHRGGNLGIWVLPIDGGPAARLTSGPWPDMFPAWSPDGATIAFHSGRDDGVNAFVVPTAGGESRQITTGAVSKYFPRWSPDGLWIYFASNAETSGGRQVYRMPATGGVPEQVTKAPVYYYRWSRDGTRMYFPGVHRGSDDLWELTLSSGRERRLTRFTQRNGGLGEMAMAASTSHLYFTWRSDVGDIWVMDVVPDEEQ